jgi:hypothetical protein
MPVKSSVITTVVVALLVAGCSVTTNTTTSNTTEHTVDLLHDRGAAQRAITAIEKHVGASPAQVREVLVYPEYMIVEAQDPNVPDHLDSYTWRDGAVEPPEPVHLSGPQEDVITALFPTSALDFHELPRIARAAEGRLEHARPTPIEEAHASSFDVERSTTLDGRVTIRISIDGPRRSGRVEAGASGSILSAEVD